jgi:glutamate N-acetyltransferase / amino-acid N-acetyltransferase
MAVNIRCGQWPEAVWSSGIACGIKPSGRADLAVLVGERPLGFAGVFTQNAARAACVEWSQSLVGLPVRALIANSGNANACTGDAGAHAVEETAAAAAERVGCRPEEVVVASTGPIGVPLPVDKIVAALPTAIDALQRDAEPFARSLMTTDTFPKWSSVANPRVAGVAKGAAMVAPNMATMLAFLVTDVPLETAELQDVLAAAVDRTFNRISIDACESTNDSVMLFSTGTGSTPAPDAFARAVEEVCGELARQIVLDAEGATKFVRIAITGAPDEAYATGVGRAVAASDLWRAALHGADPNWGRVLAAAGGFDRMLDLSRIEVALGDVTVFAGGEPRPDANDAAGSVLREDDVTVHVSLGAGGASADILTADLSPEYVKLNAFGTT